MYGTKPGKTYPFCFPVVEKLVISSHDLQNKTIKLITICCIIHFLPNPAFIYFKHCGSIMSVST